MEMDIDSYGKANLLLHIHIYIYYFIDILHILHDLYIIFSSNYIFLVYLYLNGTRIVLCHCLGGGD